MSVMMTSRCNISYYRYRRAILINFHRCFLQRERNKNTSTILSHQHNYSSSSSTKPQYKVAKITEDGNVDLTTLSINEILQRGVHARDLFTLALSSSQEQQQSSNNPFQSSRLKRSPSAILPRNNDIIISFGSIRAVIGPQEGILFDAHKPTIQLLAQEIGRSFRLHSHISIQNLTHKDHSSETNSTKQDAFEFIFLEEILREVSLTYTRRLQLYEPIVDAVVTRVSNDMYAASGVHRLVPVKDSLQDFEMQVKSALKCLTDLLEDDQDMLGMLLTEKMEARQIGTQIEHMRHESVELLLEEYTRQLTNVLQETNFLLKKVQSQQELVAISLDAFRNRMIRMNLYLSIASVGIASSTAIAGYYGMNLIHGLEDNPTAFINVVSGTTFAGLLFGGGCIAYIRGASSNARSMERLREIEVIDGALSPTKMGALDYTMKILAENKVAMTKHDFRDKMMASDQLGMIPEKELDLLFGALDITKDGFISTNDFRSLADLGRKVNLEIQSDGDGK
eukprot:scaffold3111_cov263-Chaetoceros_neogracile.AAC.13